MRTFDRLFKRLLDKGIKIYVITRDPREHEIGMEIQSEDAITWCETIGIQVFISDSKYGTAEKRSMPDFDRDKLYLKIKTASGKSFSLYIKPGWIQNG